MHKQLRASDGESGRAPARGQAGHKANNGVHCALQCTTDSMTLNWSLRGVAYLGVVEPGMEEAQVQHAPVVKDRSSVIALGHGLGCGCRGCGNQRQQCEADYGLTHPVTLICNCTCEIKYNDASETTRCCLSSRFMSAPARRTRHRVMTAMTLTVRGMRQRPRHTRGCQLNYRDVQNTGILCLYLNRIVCTMCTRQHAEYRCRCSPYLC